MTFHHSDYRIERLINQRQSDILGAARESRRPSALRVRLGLALIALGEHLRGRTPGAATPEPAPYLHDSRKALA